MKVVKQWQDQNCPDGFPNIFEMDDGTYVFTSEKRAAWRDEGGDLLDEAYKSGFRENPQVSQALEEIGVDVVVEPFDDELRAMWERSIDTSMGY